MKKLFTALLSLMCLAASAQTLDINVLTDSIHVLGAWSETRDLRFSNRQTTYSPQVARFGVQFFNGQQNVMTNNVSIANLFGSPIIGVHGAGTEVIYNGQFKSDDGQSLPSITLFNGGKFVLGPQAVVDLILPSYYTRQMWVNGDSTGIFEVDSNYIADLTQNGTVPNGCGSLRFSKCVFVSHKTHSLPMGYRPNTITGIAQINSHLVFHNKPGSTWVVKSNKQEYRGGLWVEQTMRVITEKGIVLNGVNTFSTEPQGGGYTNYGGIHLFRPDVKLYKSGTDTLFITGHQSYNRNAAIVAEEGTVFFGKDPYVDSLNVALYPNVPRAIALNGVLNGGNYVIDTKGLARFKNFFVNNMASVLEVKAGTTVFVDSISAWGGVLRVKFEEGTQLNQGSSFTIFRHGSTSNTGTFAAVEIPDFNGAITWDLSNLYTTGVISVASGSAVVGRKLLSLESLKFNNPVKNNLSIQGLEGSYTYEVKDIQGKSVLKGWLHSNDIDLKALVNGLYYCELSKNDKLAARLRFIKQ